MSIHMPTSLDEALQMLGAIPDARLMAGGTDLMVHWPDRLELHDRAFIDLSGVDAFDEHRLTPEGLVIGGGTTYWQILEDRAVCADFPLLAEAARQVGAVQIQTRGTWAGNVANGSPAADGVVALMAYDATLELRSATETELVPLASFYTGYKEMKLRPGQLIRAIRLPRRDDAFARFEKVGSRRAQAITKAGVAITHDPRRGWRVAVNSVAPTVTRCRALETALDAGASIAGVADVAALIAEDIAPIDDLRSTAEYRRRVLARVLFALLEDARHESDRDGDPPEDP